MIVECCLFNPFSSEFQSLTGKQREKKPAWVDADDTGLEVDIASSRMGRAIQRMNDRTVITGVGSCLERNSLFNMGTWVLVPFA